MGIHLGAQHIPGVSNTVADAESRTQWDRSDWMLCPLIFQAICRMFGLLEVDLFASRLTHQLPRFFSWKPVPLSEAVDAFQQDWGRICQSTMVPDQQSLEPSPPTTSSTGVGSTGMEGSDLVPSSTGDVMGFSLSNHSSSGSNPEANRLSNGTSASTSRVAHLRQRFLGRGISEEASKLMLSSWRSKSAQSYDSHFRKWASWCAERGCDPISGPASEVANFLAELFHQGYQSRFLNAFRSAISSVHNQVDSVAVGQHPTICRLLKGAFHERPPLPRYTATWNVQTVLQYLEGMGPTATLSLKFLTFKLVMLLALTRPSRSADLAALQLDH